MKREWQISTVDDEGGEDYSSVMEGMVEAVTILSRLGGVLGVTAHRVEYEPGQYAVDRFIFKFDSYAPGHNLPVAERVPDNGEVQAEPESVEA